MPTANKAATIEQTKAKYDRSVGVIFTEYRGLKVKELQNLRRSLKEKGGEIQVVKNTLFRKAAGDDVANLPDELGSGPTAVAFLYENETDCAKALFAYQSRENGGREETWQTAPGQTSISFLTIDCKK